jgi:hypothetical protein
MLVELFSYNYNERYSCCCVMDGNHDVLNRHNYLVVCDKTKRRELYENKRCFIWNVLF